MNSHRRKISAYQLPKKNYEEDIHTALSLLNLKVSRNQTEDQSREDEDISQLLVKELTFHTIPFHKRLKSYGPASEIERVIESINKAKMQETVELQLKKTCLKQQILENLGQTSLLLLSKYESHSNSHDSSETCWEAPLDNRHILKVILDEILQPPNLDYLLGLFDILPENHYSILVQNALFLGIYIKQERKFTKIFGDKDCPLDISCEMILQRYKYKQYSLVELPERTMEEPDVITLNSF